ALSVMGAKDGLWDWDLKNNKIYFSPRWKEILGYQDEEIGNTPESWFSLVHPDDLEMLKTEINAHLEGFKAHLEAEFRILHKNQNYRWVLVRGLAIRDKVNKPTRMAGSLTDITDRKRAEEQLLHDAFHDSLTGLPNRALFLDRLNQACERAKRFSDFIFTVLHLNLDRFRIFNESLGHNLSDRLLKMVSEKIKNNLRPGDTLARFGADEFLILLEDIKDASEASRIAQKIIEDIGQPVNLEGNEIFLTASVGLVMSTEGIEKPEDYLRNAHIAMHKAKTKAKGSYVFFNEEMYQKALENLKMESFLRKAIEKKEFCVHYQPIFDLFTGALMGFEALVRWKHPEKGILSPKDFLPLAEEAGFIPAIDQFVLSTSCFNFRKWLNLNAKVDKLYVSVNFSSKEFSNPKLINKIAQILKETGLEPAHLVIEITESTIMENIASAQNIFFQLQKLGVKLFLDDFGTGYSSLSYLHHFLIDTLKIDRAFVGQIKERKEQNPIVQTIVSLAHNMNMQVLAEGVETELQYKKLKDLKCNCAQGYYFSYPVDSSVIEEKIIKSYLLD
ncbi:MAG: EAL domain-containing protein, partial [Thermoanaerobaculia bacterium]